MAKLVFAMNVSLDGYVDHDRFAPDPVLFRHWTEMVQGAAGSLYGRRIYEIMRYWDEDRPEWSADEQVFARAWRAMPKWVVSRTMTAVGPNATLAGGDAEAVARELRERARRRGRGVGHAACGEPWGAWAGRRVPALRAPRGAGAGDAVLRGRAAAAAVHRERADRGGGDPADLCAGVTGARTGVMGAGRPP